MSRFSEKKASALSYDPARDRAPRLVAQGKGSVAASMIGIAQAHGVEVVVDPELCELTSALPLHSEIPENLYTAMAGLFGMLLKARKSET